MKKGTLILLCGLPGAGKTTLAKKLEGERRAIRLCPDDWILGIMEDANNIVERDRLRDPVEQLLWRDAQKLIEVGNDVILENGFWGRLERNQYKDHAKKMGAQVELHFLEAELDTLWARVEKRNSESTEFTMTKKEMEDSYKVFEPPTDEEMREYDFSQKYSSN
jgi:predicted kinase